jgi:hypothetical protein
MNRIPVALFRTRGEAEPIQRRLAEVGIAAEIQEEVWLQKLWFVSKQAAEVRLEVPAEQFERAEALLESWDSHEGAALQAVRCPECNSLLIDFPQFARHSVMTNIAAGLLAETGLVEKDYYCEQCHFAWPKEGSTPARARAHLAPFYFIEGVPRTPSATPGRPLR